MFKSKKELENVVECSRCKSILTEINDNLQNSDKVIEIVCANCKSVIYKFILSSDLCSYYIVDNNFKSNYYTIRDISHEIKFNDDF